MNAGNPKHDLTETKPETSPPEPKQPTSAIRRVARRTRALADFLDSTRSSLRRSGLPTKPVLPAEEEAPELLDLLHEGPDAMVVLHRSDGMIEDANHRFAEWAGVERNALHGKLFLSLFPETERKAARTLYEDAGAGGVHVVELPCATPGTRPRLVEFTAAQSQSGHGSFAIVIGRDVGERAATERYLRAERDRLNLFIRAMRDSLILLSPGGDILYANPTAEQMFEPYELPVICHRWLHEFSRNDKPDLQGLASAYEGQTLELEGSDGRAFLVTRSFLFESGRKTMLMLMAKDITEQRLVEKQNHQLEIELIRESKLAEFGMLSAGIAHNLNNPLMGILGFCDLIELKHSDLPEIAQIRQQANVMRDIVSTLLHKSRSERETKPQDLVIEDLIHSELQMQENNLFFKHQVKKIVDLDPNAPPIRAVYSDFSQVISNLIRNAIDAMYKSEEKVLTVRTRMDGSRLLISVSDTGCGIREEDKPNLFKPFFTTKPKRQDAAQGEPTGTGLGLSTCRNILAHYGAEIGVESEAGKGTTFTIAVPLHRQSAP